jgi:hypothetical protein
MRDDDCDDEYDDWEEDSGLPEINKYGDEIIEELETGLRYLNTEEELEKYSGSLKSSVYIDLLIYIFERKINYKALADWIKIGRECIDPGDLQTFLEDYVLDSYETLSDDLFKRYVALDTILSGIKDAGFDNEELNFTCFVEKVLEYPLHPVGRAADFCAKYAEYID